MSKAQANYVKNFFDTRASGKFFGLSGSWKSKTFNVDEDGIVIDFFIVNERLHVRANTLDLAGECRENTQTMVHHVALDGSENIVDHIKTVLSYLHENTNGFMKELLNELSEDLKYIEAARAKLFFIADPKDELKEIVETINESTLDKLKAFKQNNPTFDPISVDQMILGLSVINNFR
jgi:hypothetical protein